MYLWKYQRLWGHLRQINEFIKKKLRLTATNEPNPTLDHSFHSLDLYCDKEFQDILFLLASLQRKDWFAVIDLSIIKTRHLLPHQLIYNLCLFFYLIQKVRRLLRIMILDHDYGTPSARKRHVAVHGNQSSSYCKTPDYHLLSVLADSHMESHAVHGSPDNLKHNSQHYMEI